jgi:hypothetical protein
MIESRLKGLLRTLPVLIPFFGACSMVHEEESSGATQEHATHEPGSAQDSGAKAPVSPDEQVKEASGETWLSTRLFGRNQDCRDGGAALQWGLDANGNDRLDDAEVAKVDRICNRIAPYPDMVSVTMSAEPSSATTCSRGGIRLTAGSGSQILCNGPRGPRLSIRSIAPADEPYTCAVLNDGRVQCWGQVRSFDESNLFADSPIPKVVPDLDSTLSVVAGTNRACALHEDGGVYCWGGWQSQPARRVPDLDAVSALSARYETTCALLRNQ